MANNKDKKPIIYPKGYAERVRKLRTKGVPGPIYDKDTLLDELSNLSKEDVEYSHNPDTVGPVEYKEEDFSKNGEFDKDAAYSQLEKYKNKGNIKLLEKLRTFENLRSKGMPLKEAADTTDLQVWSGHEGLDNKYVGERVGPGEGRRNSTTGEYRTADEVKIDQAMREEENKRFNQTDSQVKALQDKLRQEGHDISLKEAVNLYRELEASGELGNYFPELEDSKPRNMGKGPLNPSYKPSIESSSKYRGQKKTK